MNQQIFESGQASYKAGDWAAAASAFAQAKTPGEVAGRLEHLRGNALMQLGRYDEAAAAYAEALRDASYGMVGALCTNRGRALVAAGRLSEAIESLKRATEDESYATPYKAYMALGGACHATGNIRGAGIAYRKAAIDEANPDPCGSLRKLGSCFMELNRINDAIESFRTAIDFAGDERTRRAVYLDLALAYVAANRMSEAVDAFGHASANGTIALPASAQAAYDAASSAVALRASERAKAISDDALSASESAYPLDPLDPTGNTSADLMPSPEDTGFFSLSEEELVFDDQRRRKKRGGRIFAVLLVILLVIGAAGGFAYYRGFGWPTQESVVLSLFDAKTEHADTSRYLAKDLDDEAAQQILAFVPSGATVSVTGVNRATSESEVLLTATLAEGGEQSYVVSLVRDGLGWRVSGIDPQFAALDTVPVDGAEAGGDATAAEQAPAEAAPEQASAEESPAPEGGDEAAPEAAPVVEEVSEGSVDGE